MSADVYTPTWWTNPESGRAHLFRDPTSTVAACNMTVKPPRFALWRPREKDDRLCTDCARKDARR